MKLDQIFAPGVITSGTDAYPSALLSLSLKGEDVLSLAASPSLEMSSPEKLNDLLVKIWDIFYWLIP